MQYQGASHYLLGSADLYFNIVKKKTANGCEYRIENIANFVCSQHKQVSLVPLFLCSILYIIDSQDLTVISLYCRVVIKA